jgi:hypothetical protein
VRSGLLVLGAAVVLVCWTVTDAGSALTAALLVLVAGLPAAAELGPRWCRWWGGRRGVPLPTDVDRAARVDSLLLDVGTVTTGRLKVAVVEPIREGDERNLRWFAGALGHAGDDEVARALARGAPRGRLSGVVAHPGDGIAGSVDRHPVRVGTPAWIGRGAPDHPPLPGTTVAVEVDGRLLGRLGLVAEVRPEAAPAVARVAGLGIEAVLVSAGPVEEAARLAAELGEVRWEAPLDAAALAAIVASLPGTTAYAGPAQPPAPVVVLPVDRVDLAVAALELARTVHARSVLAGRIAVAVALGATGLALVWAIMGA